MSETSLGEISIGRHALRTETPMTAMTELLPRIETPQLAETPFVPKPMKDYRLRGMYVPVASLVAMGLLVGNMDTRPTVHVQFDDKHKQQNHDHTTPPAQEAANIPVMDKPVTGSDIASLHGAGKPMDGE